MIRGSGSTVFDVLRIREYKLARKMFCILQSLNFRSILLFFRSVSNLYFVKKFTEVENVFFNFNSRQAWSFIISGKKFERSINTNFVEDEPDSFNNLVVVLAMFE